MLAVRRDGERLVFTIRVTPHASSNAVSGERDGVLLVRVTAPPVEGKANDAVVARISVPRDAEAALRQLTK